MNASRWTYARRSCQILCLVGFLWLFVQTEYRGTDDLPYPVGLLFRLDPLAALADALASGPFGWGLLWPALVVLFLTAVFGRFFCGWICPLGATLDGLGKLLGRGRRAFSPSWRRIKYYLLFALSAAALFGVQLLRPVRPAGDLPALADPGALSGLQLRGQPGVRRPLRR